MKNKLEIITRTNLVDYIDRDDGQIYFKEGDKYFSALMFEDEFKEDILVDYLKQGIKVVFKKTENYNPAFFWAPGRKCKRK